MTCDYCETVLRPLGEKFTQATRSEPMRSLGFWAYCDTCKVHVEVPGEQLALDPLSSGPGIHQAILDGRLH